MDAKQIDERNLDNLLFGINLLFIGDSNLKRYKVEKIFSGQYKKAIRVSYDDSCYEINIDGNRTIATLICISNAIYNGECMGMFYKGIRKDKSLGKELEEVGENNGK
ncbi:MAG: hypothetical protein RSA49_05385 [Anaerovoracaceae bacterium]